VKTASRNVLMQCPKCSEGSLSLPGERARAVRCGACAAPYPVNQGVLDLCPSTAGQRSLVQLAMEWEPLVGAYESRWWRRGALAALATGIPFERERDLILRAAKVSRGDTVLDLACGTGIYTRPLASRARPGLVVGLDLSLPMLRRASQLARQQKLKNIILIRDNALQLPFLSERFDLVNCGSGLHLFPNAARVLREVHRVLKTGGRLTVSTVRWYSGPLASQTADYAARVTGVHPFSADELQARCTRVGLAEVKFHYANRLCLIMSARKVVETSAQRPR
jgi:SAM-dependent methyltransferase